LGASTLWYPKKISRDFWRFLSPRVRDEKLTALVALQPEGRVNAEARLLARDDLASVEGDRARPEPRRDRRETGGRLVELLPRRHGRKCRCTVNG